MSTETAPKPVTMDELVALCLRRGFIFQASEIYGGINGFWDYGPLGVELKNNIRDAWWHRMVKCSPVGPDGEALTILGLDSSIIQHPKVWEASGHIGGFNDPMVDCRETKSRYRFDHLQAYRHKSDETLPLFAFVEGEPGPAQKKIKKAKKGDAAIDFEVVALTDLGTTDFSRVIGPDAKATGTLTEPRQFNLMFKTYVGAVQDEDSVAYLRPETAQGIFLNYRRIVDTMRVKAPFGIAQIGKAFRNEITPRNFTFRSREFEQAELEFFCHPSERERWFEYWLDERLRFHKELGFEESSLRVRPHGDDELAHYCARAMDVEFLFPFGWQEIEGIHDRGDWDLSRHGEYSGKDLAITDEETKEKFTPMCIETSVGIDRTTLALLVGAYDEETLDGGDQRVVMRFHPALAPVTVALLPLSKKLQPQVEGLERELRRHFSLQYDHAGNIGRRYRRQDEIGTPWCVTYDFESADDGKVTVRQRDSMEQDRIPIDGVAGYLRDALEAAS